MEVKVEVLDEENVDKRTATGYKFEVFHSVEELNAYIKTHEEATLSKFIVYNKDKMFGNDKYRPDRDSSIGHISWLEDNVPHIRVGRKRYGCHQGRDKQLRAKERYRERKRKAEEEGLAVPKKRRLYPDTKKMSCPFQFTAVQIIKFPEFELESGASTYLKQKTTAVIKAALRDGEPIEMLMEYHVIIPPTHDHKNHPIDGPIAHQREKVADEVIDKITELARQGIMKVSEMKPHLERFVENDLGVKDETKTRRRFYPTKKDFQNIMQKARKMPSQSLLDKENLQELIDRWQTETPSDCFYFRPWESEQSFLFCYQTLEQKRLLKLYGDHVCLLDATTRTCSYAQPLYFVCVRTNVGYFVAGVFIVQHETAASVQEALEVLLEWNPNWRPKCFLVDFNTEDILALETSFPECSVLISDFHREKAWNEWVTKNEGAVDARVKAMLARVCQAATVQLYHEALDAFQSSAAWRESEELKDWFSNDWLPHVQRWASAFRPRWHSLLIRINGGVERQNEVLRSAFLDTYKNCSISNLLTVIVTDFLPKFYNRYVELNYRRSSNSKSVPCDLPNWVVECPMDISQHLMKRWRSQLSDESVHQGSDNQSFLVASEVGSSLHYEVRLGDATQPPSCTCIDWGRHMLPCVHMCTMLKFNICSWNDLGEIYVNNPVLKIDKDCIAHMVDNVKLESNDYGESVCKIYIDEERDPVVNTQKGRQALRRSCLEKLRSLTKYVNVMQDEDCLEELDEELEDMVRNVRSGVQGATVHL